ncbi:MAG: ECF transporter S component [Oscillospiraceae bacterium]|jgi:riboflavin transporter FmnP|nr:ECF transporter S component [Oscillospiraceae bacterium]
MPNEHTHPKPPGRAVNTRMLVIVALFSALSSVLMYLDFPLPFFPPFLKLDFSDLPALLGTFWFGPSAGIAVALVKNLIHLFISSTGGVGELANFIVSAALTGTAGLVYRLRRTRGGAVAGLACGTLAMTLAGIAANYYLLLPFFAKVMPMETIVAMCARLIPSIRTTWDIVLLSITPFNLFKGALISGLTFLLYKRVKGFMSETAERPRRAAGKV